MILHPYNVFRYVTVRDILPTAEWCEKNVYISPRVPTSEPGQWQAATVAALCRPGGPLEALDDPDVETVVVRKGSQTALTTTAYCWLAHVMDADPSSALIVMNSAQDAKEKSDETWRVMWEDSPRLQRFLPADRRKNWTKMFQRINNSPVYWIGANSPGRLGSKPIRRLVLDEVDKYPMQTASEAGAAALARQRVKAFRKKGMAKILEFSTPTSDAGEIENEYRNGDQRQLWVRCWHCKAAQVMVWKNFKLDMTLAKTDAPTAIKGAHYECPTCKKSWTDDQRWAAIDGGEWRPSSVPKDPKTRSYWLPSWCSKFVTVSYLASQWVRAQESRSGLQDFINSECGEPFVHVQNAVKDTQFLALEGGYAEGQMWTDCPVYGVAQEIERAVFGGCDVQKGYLVVVFRQFIRGGDSGLIWAGDCGGFDSLDGMADRFGVQFIVMDQRYRTREVQEWCFARPGYIPSMGVVRRARQLFSTNVIDLDEGRRGGSGRKVEMLDYDGDMLKDILAKLIQRGDGANRWMVPKGYASNKTYTDQMTAERLVNGRWVNPQDKPNHFWDAECLALLAAVRFGFFGAYTNENQ